MNQKKINYKNAGVDIEKADLFVDQIKKLTRQTLNKKVVSGVGGFASLYELNKNQLLAAGTDGVGTKLKLAFESGIHHTIGVDLVAMCVNDLLCVGARPLFFLDYFATGSLDRKQSVKVLEGIVKGCLQSQCALVGGETAEMPGLYQAGEYDLAGFAVGLVDKKKLLPKYSTR
jgi:phosphoribosylformylglycinamidine cyclo-ligase